ncbi:hydroxymethylbilane synthase [Filimonas lacunae]|uniref:Hydroxymethylbilane synthase n=1 Tax=Filimonas lacunae TaxID=477680 RepID=A0A173MN30_9BACT|nr:hydroxymethylbilane synthase [Filimonas lacunae]BAV09044.1 porphobilinogen deaminase [Filimonas lacunae]SIS66345.1 hydroxymethylbilane synthase [Filimonas lacunae]
MSRILKIGTRDSELAVWQATLVQNQLAAHNIASELVYIKSDGDIDLVTPLYEIGVQGVFTKTLDAALLSKRIDIAVHSMKDVPTQLAKGITQAAVLKRASSKDILVHKGGWELVNGEWTMTNPEQAAIIATSSIRRKAQWLNRYPHHTIENLRGNVNTRLQKVADSNWTGAIFAAAGLERIEKRPDNSFELDWMLPAAAQGAIMVVCREEEPDTKEACGLLNDADTALCVKLERDFLRTLMGGCSTPISALAAISNNTLTFTGNIYSLDGSQKKETHMELPMDTRHDVLAQTGNKAAWELLQNGADKIVEEIRNAGY